MKTKIVIIGILVILTLINLLRISFSDVNAIPAKTPNVNANLPKADKIQLAPGISVNQLKEREKTINDVIAMKEYNPIPDDKNLLVNIDLELVQTPDISIPVPDPGKQLDPSRLIRIPAISISPAPQQITPLPQPLLNWKNYYNPQMKYERFFILGKALSRTSILWNNAAQQDNTYHFFGATSAMSATTTTTIGKEKDEDSIYFSVI